MNNLGPPDPWPIQPVRVRRHHVDWGRGDFDEVTAHRVLSLGKLLLRGAWYLNPRFTVSSPSPTAEFFRKVIELRSSWLRTCRQSLGNSGQRRLARQARRQGRLATYLVINESSADKPRTLPLPTSVPWSDLSDSQRREVVEVGDTSKQLSSSGILFIDGDQISPRSWQAQAKEILARRLS